MSKPRLNINSRRARQGRGGLRLALTLGVILLLAVAIGFWLLVGVR